MDRRSPTLERAAALLLCTLLPACHVVEEEPTAARAALTPGDGAPGQHVAVDAGSPQPPDPWPWLDAGSPLDAGLPPPLDAGVPGCARRPLMPWSPAGGELDARPFTEVELARDPSDPGRYRWSLTVPGAVAEVRAAPPVMSDLPTYHHRVDYDGWFEGCPGYTTIDAWFVAGIYTVDVLYADGRPSSLFTLFAGAIIPSPRQGDIPLPGAKEQKDPNCAQHAQWSQIPSEELTYDPGAFVIEETTSDNTYIARAAAVMGESAVRAADVPTAVTKLEAAYAAKGGAVAAVLVGHGSSTSISVGAGQAGQVANTYLFMKGHRANKTFKDGLTKNGAEHHVRRVALVGCCVAGQLHDLKKDHLICDLATGLAPVGETEILAWMSKTNVVEASGNRAGYFTVAGTPWALYGRRIKKGHCAQW